jgi:hypothetical protein
MNISNTTVQTGHHHHHHHHHQGTTAGNAAASSSTSSNGSSKLLVNQQQQQQLQQQNQNLISVAPKQFQNATSPINHNPSVHRFQSLNDNPWLLQSTQPQHQGPTPPLRQHKRNINPPSHSSSTSTSSLLSSNVNPPSSKLQLQQQQPPVVNNLSVLSSYNQPVYLKSQSLIIPSSSSLGVQSISSQQTSPKSPNQGFINSTQVVGGAIMNNNNNNSSSSGIMSTSINNCISSSMKQSTSSQPHHNNNNANFDDLNVNGQITRSTSSYQNKSEVKLNSMP